MGSGIATRWRWLGWLALTVLIAACSHGARPRTTSGQAAGALPLPAWQRTDPRFTALPGAQALYGQLGQAVYEIEVPDQWNGELVMYAHGFVGLEPFLIVTPPPLRAHLIQGGFAWAASSFSANGYNPQVGVDDTLALLDYFKRAVGEPKRTYIYGTSMGGHVVVSSLEQDPSVYSGALSECGVVDGVGEMDYLASYVAVAQYLTRVPLLPITSGSAFQAAVKEKVIPALTGPTGGHLSDAGTQFESVMKYLTGGPRPFQEQGFLDRLSGNFSVTFDEFAHKTPASRAGTNVGMTYHIDPGLGVTDDQLNAGVYRLAADPAVRSAEANPAFAPLTGRIEVPLLTLHTIGDAFVPFSLEQAYRRTVDAAGNGNLLVQRAIRRPDHCQFSSAELEKAWDDLVQWVEHGVKPDGDDVLAPNLSRAGLRWTQPLLPNDPGRR